MDITEDSHRNSNNKLTIANSSGGGNEETINSLDVGDRSGNTLNAAQSH